MPMQVGLVLAVWLLAALVSLLVLYLIIRAAVRDGVRQALRPDLLREVDWSKDGPPPPRGPRAFREEQGRK